MTSTATAKAAFIVATAGHARHLLAQAEARVTKYTEAYQAAVADVKKYTELAKTLPESAGKPAAKKVNYGLGADVNFAYGRGETRKTLTGKVVAKNDEGTQYLIEVGTGFESERFKVFGGSILGLVGGEQSEPEADPLAPVEDALAVLSQSPADDIPFDADKPESEDDPLAA